MTKIVRFTHTRDKALIINDFYLTMCVTFVTGQETNR
jgi:hypothetical protein